MVQVQTRGARKACGSMAAPAIPIRAAASPSQEEATPDALKRKVLPPGDKTWPFGSVVEVMR